MRLKLALLACGLLFGFLTPARADPQADIFAAQQTCERWLDLLDAHRFESAWNQRQALANARTTKEEWLQFIRTRRLPLGRTLRRQRYKYAASHQIRGLPDGDYELLYYKAAFDHKQSAYEEILLVRGPGGRWQVCDYSLF